MISTLIFLSQTTPVLAFLGLSIAVVVIAAVWASRLRQRQRQHCDRLREARYLLAQAERQQARLKR